MRFTLCLALLLVLPACGQDRPAAPAERAEPSIPFRTDGQLTFARPDGQPIVTIDVEIADTDSTITRGLMQREGLPEKSGMLFLMPDTRTQTFWMANTPLALDITFVSADSTVVNTAKYTRPFTQESHASEGPARFVVETPAGFTDRWGITAGDRVTWQRTGGDAALP